MKRINYLLVVLTVLSFAMACKNVNYKKAKSDLLYKIFPSGSKDSTAKAGDWVKLNFTMKINDSVLQTSYGKAPVYVQVTLSPEAAYNPIELLPLVKSGDSGVTVALTDTLFARKLAQESPVFKKGGRLTTTFKVLGVFRNDSSYLADKQREEEKDRPRMMKEQAEEMAKRQKLDEEEMEKTKKERNDQQLKEIEGWEKTGQVAKELKEMERWLAAKKINAQKTGKGTYVFIQQQGTGPAVELGKYVNIKYTGKVLANDSIFQTSTYAIKLGTNPVIRGWDEGLQLFKQGGKGTLYIPGFLGWGNSPGPGGKPFAPVIFDVEVLEVSDKPIAQQPPPQQ
jgi:FKBP-type peptidyl-prolyl cis-trans isomerase FkpA